MAKQFENLTKAEIIKIMLDPWPFIRQQIDYHGWSSLTVSDLSGVSASTIRALINGQNKRASQEIAQKLLKLCINKYLPAPVKETPADTNRKARAAVKKKVAKKKVSKKKVVRKRRASVPEWAR